MDDTNLPTPERIAKGDIIDDDKGVRARDHSLLAWLLDSRIIEPWHGHDADHFMELHRASIAHLSYKVAAYSDTHTSPPGLSGKSEDYDGVKRLIGRRNLMIVHDACYNCRRRPLPYPLGDYRLAFNALESALLSVRDSLKNAR